MKVILINGKKRHGKDHVAQLLRERLQSQGNTVEVHSYADPMKRIISTMLGLTIEKLDQHKNNRSLLVTGKDTICDFRELIQRFGTEAMQTEFGKTVWVDRMLSVINNKECDYFIIPDFRFPDESLENSGLDVVSIQVENRDIICTDSHKSENALDGFVFDHYIDNTGKPNLSPQITEFIEMFL